jgi:hypothetical protein
MYILSLSVFDFFTFHFYPTSRFQDHSISRYIALIGSLLAPTCAPSHSSIAGSFSPRGLHFYLEDGSNMFLCNGGSISNVRTHGTPIRYCISRHI